MMWAHLTLQAEVGRGRAGGTVKGQPSCRALTGPAVTCKVGMGTEWLLRFLPAPMFSAEQHQDQNSGHHPFLSLVPPDLSPAFGACPSQATIHSVLSTVPM